MGRIVKMVCVTENNNNKFYNLVQQDDSTWLAEWGRVGSSPSTKTYSMREWEKTYKAKLKRGYRDVTDLVSVAKEDESAEELSIRNAKPSVSELINFLQTAAKGTIKKNYTVAVADVTQKQVDAAQVMLDALIELSRKHTLDRQAINKALLEMYSIIPRRMNDTRKYLLQTDDSTDKFQRLLSNEQSLLDVMAGQVQTQQPKSKTSKKGDLNLDDYGLEIDEASEADKKRIAKETDLDLTKVARIFVVRHGATAKAYEKKKVESSTSKEMLLYHGSRNENWWSILNNGLKIRPANAIHTGSMFGDGIYWANKARKSIGYTSLSGSYWASGSSSRAYLALFNVNIGKTWDIFAGGKRHSSEHSRLNNSKVRSSGYDSVYARGGADLRNDEYIVYEEGRATIKYLIELRQ